MSAEIHANDAVIQLAEEQFRLVVEASPCGILLVNQSGVVQLVNKEVERMFNCNRTEIIGRPVEDLVPSRYREEHKAFRADYVISPSARAMGPDRELYAVRKDGSEFPVEIGLNPFLTPDGMKILGTILDISERKRAESEQKKLEDRLRQAEKMEAIGQLAGGVAHDFNNLLTAILGYADAVDVESSAARPSNPRVLEHLQRIREVVRLAGDLTHRLLAFSRRQVLKPRAINLNDCLADVEELLRRLIPENIHLRFTKADALHAVLADPGQIEQIILNLALNARDAMPDGGSLILETRNAVLDEQYAAWHVDVSAGEFVVLTISDSGCGMDAATQARIFEPFFTTKGVGRGTGMGLATVYGIVKQSSGHISVYSEVGRGTTFKVFLPAVRNAQLSHREPAPLPIPPKQPGGGETILVCEDDPLVRWVIENTLVTAGYKVIVADDPIAALALSVAHRESVDLLVSDVVMPNMNGKMLATRIAASRPGIKVLFVSGYTSDVIVHQNVLDPGVELLEKPFGCQELLQRVRQLLDAPILVA